MKAWWLPLNLLYLCTIWIKNSRQELSAVGREAYTRNYSMILDKLLHGYDSTLRPQFGGPPIDIEIDINVRSMGPVSEVDMTYSMDCYFRQTWVDHRLVFEGALSTMTLSNTMLRKIWKPDTYFHNGLQSYVHLITMPNKFVRINQDGRVLYSQRLTIKASCPMMLEYFPMDTQHCPLKIGSFGYTNVDMLYRWNANRQIVTSEDMKMSQFDLINSPQTNATESRANGDFSMLLVTFYLQRHTGYFLIQVYFPCSLLVVLSWVSFWLNREATADRVSLGVTTVLTMTFLGLDARNDLPKVPYGTALDMFVALSFAFIFATILQFALVHFYTKVGYGDEMYTPSESEESDGEDAPIAICSENYALRVEQGTGDKNYVSETDTRPSTRGHTLSRCGCLSGALVHPSLDIFKLPNQRRSVPQSFSPTVLNSVSKIDVVSRVLFPLSFVIINVFYWIVYMSKAEASASI